MPDVYKAKARSEGVFRSLSHLKTSNPLAAFSVVPDNCRFENQEKDEKIILLLRQHPIVTLPWILLTTFLLVLPGFWELLPLVAQIPVNFVVMTMVMWYLLVGAFALEKFLDWYFNVYIVTDERVVDIDFYGLLYKDMTVVKLDSVQEINYVQAGGVAAMFNYGDVYIQTAAEKRQLDFLRVPNPNKVVDILYQLQQEEEQEKIEGRVN